LKSYTTYTHLPFPPFRLLQFPLVPVLLTIPHHYPLPHTSTVRILSVVHTFDPLYIYPDTMKISILLRLCYTFAPKKIQPIIYNSTREASCGL
jgi:hypothetical protein